MWWYHRQTGVRELLRDQKQGWERGGRLQGNRVLKSNLHITQLLTHTWNCIA